MLLKKKIFTSSKSDRRKNFDIFLTQTLLLQQTRSLLLLSASQLQGRIGNRSHGLLSRNVTTELLAESRKEHGQHAVAPNRLAGAGDVGKLGAVANEVEGEGVVTRNKDQVPRLRETVVVLRAEVVLDPFLGFEADGHFCGDDTDVVEFRVLDDVADFELVLFAGEVEVGVVCCVDAIFPGGEKSKSVHGKSCC